MITGTHQESLEDGGSLALCALLCSPGEVCIYLLQRCIFVCINVYICCTECITLSTHVTGVLRGVLVWYKPTSYPLLSCALWRVFIPTPEMHLFSAQMYTFMCTISTCIYTCPKGSRRGPGGTEGPPVTLRPSVLSTGDMHRYAYHKYTA